MTTAQRKFILIVDDDESVSHILNSILTRRGYHVLHAWDGLSAIQIALSNVSEIKLVVADMNLPDMHGEEVLQEIGSLSPDIRCLLCTGDPNLAAGGSPWPVLSKPFRPDTLLAQVAAAFST